MSEFVADNGVRVTDEMVRRWASEAESGFEGLQVELFGGRAWDEVATEPLEPRTIRVSATVWRLIDQCNTFLYMRIDSTMIPDVSIT